MNFSEQPPSRQWAALKYRGVEFAEVWFKADGEPFALSFRIPRESFQIPGMGQLLSMEKLLKAVAIATEEVESWRLEGALHSGMNGAIPDLRQPVLPPAPDETHLVISISLKPPQVVAGNDSRQPEVPLEKWQDFETRWRTILGMEANIDVLCLKMDSLRVELESALKKTLAPDERVHALNNDVALWNKAKSRAHFALPKAREFIHRATWARGAPERKKLGEIFKDHIEPHIPFPELDRVPEQLDYLLKLRQLLSSQGVTVSQECQGVVSTIQAALRTLLSNAAANAAKKKFHRP